MAKGTIGVHTENMFPIIKKWLYSDKDIFVRELVSNGCDAVSKLKRLSTSNEASISENEELFVKITVDKPGKKLIFTDNGIGMNSEEIEKYITQMAFSGAEEFLEKYQDENKETSIIGHFGLGFYSAFMVADTVEIDTLSYRSGEQSAHWSCGGGTEYEMDAGSYAIRGTQITLHVSDENEEFLESYKIREILNKYCSFLPVNIYLEDAEKIPVEGEEKEAPTPINDPSPLWLKRPSDCTDEEYKAFYAKVFMDFEPPLFYIHLNVDYPFNLKGILYFPKLRHELGSIEGQIKLYNNQVFVADNIKEVIPEYLMLLKGCIDCPDLPLNVSRSFLQNDGYVKKVSAHIIKKVADKLTGMFNTAPDDFKKYWEDINPFVKYGCIRDEGFYDKVKNIVLFKTTEDAFYTIEQLKEKAGENKTVYYVSDPRQQAQYVAMFRREGIEAVVLPHMIDNHFISFLEYKDTGLKFQRIDADISDNLKAESAQELAGVAEIFGTVIMDEHLKFEVQALKNEDIPALLVMSEQARRMQEMSAMFAGSMPPMPEEKTLIINSSNKAIIALSQRADDKEFAELVCLYVYDLAQLAHTPLNADQMTAFLSRANKLLSKLD